MASSNRRRILRLYKEDHLCRQCGQPMILGSSSRQLPNTATIEHIYPKDHPLRRRHNNLVTLICYKCNLLNNKLYSNKHRSDLDMVKYLENRRQWII